MVRFQLLLASLLLAFAVSASAAHAQAGATVPLDQGFKVRVPAFPSGAERTRQPGVWMLDIDLKPMRMRFLELTDPKTGEVSKQQVWYLVYRVFNRPIRSAGIAASVDPVNELDTPYTRPQFEPELTMVTYENPNDQIPDQTIVGEIVPEAINKLRRIEERRSGIKLNGAIQAMRPLPEASDDAQPIYGVAIFRGVDPDTDFFKVVLRGFTNAYELRDDDQGKRMWRKVLVQKFKRPGDRFDPTQDEFAFDGDPEWMYIPAELITDPDIIAANDDLKTAAPASE